MDFLIFSFGVYSSKSGVSNLNDWSSPSGQTRGSTSAVIVFVCNKIKVQTLVCDSVINILTLHTTTNKSNTVCHFKGQTVLDFFTSIYRLHDFESPGPSCSGVLLTFGRMFD